MLRSGLSLYRESIRQACQEDQGTPDGIPGTVGYEMQRTLADLDQHALLRHV